MESPVEHLRSRLDRSAEVADELSVAYLARRDDDALAEAGVVDRSLPLAGDVLAVKACFDVAGWTTNAGSAVLRDAPPALADAPLVQAVRAAGAILVAQTNMTEFAYGALGLNATFGTPTTPMCPGEDRVSGGSTSGGAVAVALGAADIALGSDTSGSIRIPAAFCGESGFKPSQGRYSADGLIPLAVSFDAPGFIAASVTHLSRIDAALVGRSGTPVDSCDAVHGRRFVVPRDAIDAGDTDAGVLERFDAWVAALVAGGADVVEQDLPMMVKACLAARAGWTIAVEAYDWHRDLIATEVDRYDPRVGPRIMTGATVAAADYVAAMRVIRDCRRRYDAAIHGFDAVLSPTVPILPPRVADVQTMDSYLAMNTKVLRLTEIANRLDLPSLSLPGRRDERGPIGLMLTGRRGDDAALLDLGVAVEQLLAR